jgi:DNA modification methylase
MKKTIEIKCRGAELVPLSALEPFQGNLKDLSEENYKKLRGEILSLGFSEPFSVWKGEGDKLYLLNGHQRHRVLTKMVADEGYECPDLPVSLVEAESFAQARKKVLALTSQYGQITGQGLYEFVMDSGLTPEEIAARFRFPEIDFESWNIEFFKDPAVDPQCDEDESPEPPVEPKSRPGDVYSLGRHRLVCGDSTILSDVQKLMGTELADMVWTDPPYNVAYEGKTKDALKIKNDSMSGEQFYQFLHDAYSNMLMHTKPGCAIYVAHADTEGMNFRKALTDSGWLLKQCLVWVKNSIVMGRQDYHWRHEPILYGWAPGSAHHWYSDRKQSTVIECKRPSRNAEHPTMKPVELIEYCFANSCPRGGLVLDLFGGSGSTLIAAEKTGRRAFLCELDPRYADVIVARWEKYTGKTAVLNPDNSDKTAMEASHERHL